MTKNQISFAFAGLLFGFLLGFVVAHQIYAGRGNGSVHPPVPDGGTPPRFAAEERAPIGSAQGKGPAGGGPGSMEEIQKEIASLKEILEENPRNVQALTRLGDIYFDVAMFDKAQPYYEQALALNPGDVNVETDLGIALRNLGNPQEAMRRFEAAVAARPDHWKGWFNIGIVALHDLGDAARARVAFEKVAALNPKDLDPGVLAQLRQEAERVPARKPAGGGAS